jgi:hypothetical protein
VVPNDNGTFLDLVFTNVLLTFLLLALTIMFRMADFAAIVNKLDEVHWFSLFSGKKMDCSVDLFYDTLKIKL